ncbi:hypothetical protein ACTXK0_05180 [Corynebacterium variabile]|uniref:hypothetical protein n=1 Tax=Corynebacterium variabile TaxID=1727 RepID=UPI003FD43742
MTIERLPRAMRPPAERLRSFLLTDATVLLILGACCIARGVAYTGAVGAVRTHPAEEMLSIGWWAVIWIAVGIACIAASPWHRALVAAIALAAGVSLHIAWALSYIWESADGDTPRGWVGSIGHVAVATLVLWSVWRGSREEVRVREVVPDA